MSRAGAKRTSLLALCALGSVIFASLGIWQLERLRWKLDLIDRVDARVNAAPTPLPSRSVWGALDPEVIEYRHVSAGGVFDHRRETLVDALTERGAGYWVVTPLHTADGTILVNRGFVPRDRAAARTRALGQVEGTVSITGLIRLSEPKGRFLRPNRPGEDDWYSRDVAAIAQARNLDDAAPFFLDADAAPNPGGLPVGGLTVVHFRNAHLVYALTWFGLAMLCLAGLALLLKPGHRRI